MIKNIIDCKDLSLGYSDKLLISDINVKIKSHQWVGVIGENGVGKSTFFKTILGILPTLSGELTVINNYPGKLNYKISYMPQERTLNMSENMSGMSLIRANYRASFFGIPVFSDSLKNKILYLLEMVGAIDYAEKRFSELSGGQKKHIYLAQALINSPKLILLDEPLSDLDIHSKYEFIKALKRIHAKENITLLIISHDMHKNLVNELDYFMYFKNKNMNICKNLPYSYIDDNQKKDKNIGI